MGPVGRVASRIGHAFAPFLLAFLLARLLHLSRLLPRMGQVAERQGRRAPDNGKAPLRPALAAVGEWCRENRHLPRQVAALYEPPASFSTRITTPIHTH